VKLQNLLDGHFFIFMDICLQQRDSSISQEII
jgi:hypothetical protein